MQCNDDDVRFVLDQRAYLDLSRANSLRQHSMGRHISLLGHIILLPSQSVFLLTPLSHLLCGGTVNTNFIVFGLTGQGPKPTVYRIGGVQANHYTTNVVTKLI